ncbi:MAG: DUF4340 domain-containing protein [Alphaproteobacteria bacterium]|nr:DUF4340 domain-containing protein [Alphaproteobacteria bacterium]
MRRLTVGVLGVVTAAAVVGAVVVVLNQRPATALGAGQRVFPGLETKLAGAQTIEIAKHDAKFVLARKGEAWVVPDKSDYPARADMVRKALVGLAELETVESKTRNPELLNRLNLQDPSAADSKAVQITVKDGQGAVLAALIIGKKRTPPAGASATGAPDMIYVREAGNAQTLLAQGQLEIRDAALDWAVRDVVDVSGDKVASVEITQPGAKPLVVLREKPDDKDFKIRDMPDKKTVKSQWDVNALGGVLEALTFDDVAKDGAIQVGAPKGVDRYKTKDGLTVTVTLLPKDTETWAKIEATGEGDAAAAAKEINQRTAGWLYRLPDYKRDKLLSKLDDLIQDPPKPQS